MLMGIHYQKLWKTLRPILEYYGNESGQDNTTLDTLDHHIQELSRIDKNGDMFRYPFSYNLQYRLCDRPIDIDKAVCWMLSIVDALDGCSQMLTVIKEYEGDLKPQFIAKIEKEDEKKLPEYFKLDSCIKHFKVSITEYMTDLLNLFLKNNLNFKILFQIPSSKMFTANTNYIDNFDFLFKKIKNILIIGIENKEVHAVNNYELIKLIY